MKKELNYEAIAFFCATGFFAEDDTYFMDEKYVYPEQSSFNEDFKRFRDFKWHYHPTEISLQEATLQFGQLFERIIAKQSGNDKIILPLSGGIDSRTQAVALKKLKRDVTSYSYRYADGHNESWYGKEIARHCGFRFIPLVVKEGYLWNVIEELASLNKCYSDFTHPRQMAFVDDYASMGDRFNLGHWGDVLFDGMGVADNLPFENQVQVIIKKIVKRGGLELAGSLWSFWKLEGTFREYLHSRISSMHLKTHIPENANSSIRAFKSKYWATRWTASNFCVFEKAKPIALPYFDTEMCEFICSIPESLLDKRQIQIEYIKSQAPEIAKIKWQEHKPFNLYNYHLDRSPYNLPVRAAGKISRTLNSMLGHKLVQRNWELQFTGENNSTQLNKYLTSIINDQSLVPANISGNIIDQFRNNNPLQNAHALSMLLTLSMFSKNNLS